MHSLALASWVVAVVAVSGVSGRAVTPPVITPAPSLESSVRDMVKRDGPDALSLAQVLLTAVPEWLREIAATNIPEASSIIWSEFLDHDRPSWFTDLPEDVQVYLIEQFGPKTAAPPSNPTIPSVQPSLTASSAPASSEAFSGEPSATSQAQETTAAVGSSQVSQTTAESSQKSGTATATSSSQTSGSAKTSGPPTSGITFSTEKTAPSATSAAAPSVQSSQNSGLSRNQKIGIGVGVPLGLAGAAAFLFACCFFLRRRHRKGINGSVPPSSPGFIPRFSFQEKPTDMEQRPLNGTSTNALHDWSNSNWDDDVMEPTHNQQVAPATQQQPVIAPLLFHTHSSNRARGTRTSYTSLHSVAELSEPDDLESPVLPRETPRKSSPMRQNPPRLPSLSIPPPTVAAQVKRKPIGSPPSQSPAAQAASQSLLRQSMGDGHTPYKHKHWPSFTATSPVSPIQEHEPSNPFRDGSPYVEDYGPEYQNGYVVLEDGLYGNSSLSRYPNPKIAGRSEWPLRNVSQQQRTKSPMWDRVYEG